jgi:hypothetical protein
MATHLIGMLLGTEDDWPTAFEQFVRRLDLQIQHDGETHTFATERITIEPFSLRQPARHDFVIDRLAYWYYHPREWLKKVALMDEVYLPNNPFTFQSMEKHAAFCAAIRMGFNVPETWLLPHKVPPDNERFAPTARRYNRIFDLDGIGDAVGYPMYMKPFHGGGWINVTRIGEAEELRQAFEASGRELMHVQAGVERYDVFARGLQIGAETTILAYDPTKPLHERYAVAHEFLAPDAGYEIDTFGRTIGAFFQWEHNSFEVIVRDGVAYPIDFANACPDMAIISLHYYFPWAIRTLAKWAVYCTTTGRRMRLDGMMRRFFAIADDDGRRWDDKLAGYRALTDEYLERERYEEFCATHLGHVDEVMVEYISSREFDDHLVATIGAAFPAHEHEQFIARYRGLLGAWASDQQGQAVG